ncbi:uncharacterized protein [Linepithema humile]|uniref:uncharacterized protein n=1 Tax=Linepithema humile TaxID=83485 RepID=UPI0006231FF4|nr:PREDICTED: uncharacterized protein LOC105669516 [Linepithema humile]
MAGSRGVAFTQINLHHSKGASAVLARQQAGRQTCISLMQEPWVIRGCIRGLAACGRFFRAPSVDRPRACVAVKGMEAQLISHLCSRDVAAVEVDFTDDSGDRKKMVICLAYFSHDEGEAVPPASVIKLAEYCQEKRLPLIMECDANAHHTVWGSSDTNERGRKVLEFLASTDLEILNIGDELTFCTIARREVLDITVCSRQLIQEVVEWRVSTEPSLSDHRQITFRITKARGKEVKFRNPRRTKWDSYRKDLASSLRGFPKRHGTEDKLETCVDYLQRSLVKVSATKIIVPKGRLQIVEELPGGPLDCRVSEWRHAGSKIELGTRAANPTGSTLGGHRRNIETLWLRRN